MGEALSVSQVTSVWALVLFGVLGAALGVFAGMLTDRLTEAPAGAGRTMPLAALFAALLGGFSFAVLVWKYALSLQTLRGMLFTALLLAAARADRRTGAVPDKLFLALGLNFVFFAGLQNRFEVSLVQGFWGALALSVPMLLLLKAGERLAGRKLMTRSDVKLFFAVGLYFNWRAAPFILVLCLLFAALSALILRRKPGDKDSAFPLGPSIAFSGVIALLYAEAVAAMWTGLPM